MAAVSHTTARGRSPRGPAFYQSQERAGRDCCSEGRGRLGTFIELTRSVTRNVTQNIENLQYAYSHFGRKKHAVGRRRPHTVRDGVAAA